MKLKRWIKSKVKAAKARSREKARLESEIGAVAKKAEIEAYRKESIKQAKIRGRARGREKARGGGGLLGTLGSVGEKAQRVQSQMFELPKTGSFDLFGGSQSKRRRKRKRKR